jgi:hypothetical protein
MQLQPTTPLTLRRLNSSIYAVKELIAMQRIDGYDHLIDTLLMAYYGIGRIVDELEQFERETQIQRMQSKLAKER